MAKVFNSIGSIKKIKSTLTENNIHEFKSLNEVLRFKKFYSTYENEIIENHKNIIENEKVVLEQNIEEIELSIEEIKNNIEDSFNLKMKTLNEKLNLINLNTKILVPINYIKKWYFNKKIKNLQKTYKSVQNSSTLKLVTTKSIKLSRYNFICNHFEEAVRESSELDLKRLKNKLSVIKSLKPYIYGAFGEQKVVKAIENLSDDYYLINDFDISFYNALYYAQDKSYIKSVQIDHILVCPSGIFLIETKNWSEKSINNSNLRSPISQVRRSSYILFKLLNDKSNNLSKHHWGNKKITIKNLIVLINNKPKEEFQFVKIVLLDELLNYINYFKPIYTNSETENIVNYLLKLNKKDKIYI